MPSLETHHLYALAALCITALVGAGIGAATALFAAQARERKQHHEDILGTANVTIAAMITLLGKLINFKRDQVLSAQTVAEALSETMDADGENEAVLSAKTFSPEPFAASKFSLFLPDPNIYRHASAQLDLIQLLKMLEFSLADLDHHIARRNLCVGEITHARQSMEEVHADALRLYMRHMQAIATHTDECLFFLDKGIEKTRLAAQKTLPANYHGRIADVGLKPETGPLMPPSDLIAPLSQ